MKFINEWIKVNDNLERMKVPNGWLVQSWASSFNAFSGKTEKNWYREGISVPYCVSYLKNVTCKNCIKIHKVQNDNKRSPRNN